MWSYTEKQIYQVRLWSRNTFSMDGDADHTLEKQKFNLVS